MSNLISSILVSLSIFVSKSLYLKELVKSLEIIRLIFLNLLFSTPIAADFTLLNLTFSVLLIIGELLSNNVFLLTVFSVIFFSFHFTLLNFHV
nr:MAG TPA: hypothetical protein [Caudoviricetes sp.]